MNNPRNFIGYGKKDYQVAWPNNAKLALQFVLNYEEGGENCVLNGDKHSETFLSEIIGAQPVEDRHMNMEAINEYWEYESDVHKWTLPDGHVAKVPVTEMNDIRIEIHVDDGAKWVKYTRDNFYDVIFIDCSDPSEFSNLLFSDSFYKECKRILTPKGILATQSESPESFKNIHINILKTLKNIFKVSETMYSFVPIYPSGIWSWTFASSEDLNLSKQNYDEVLKIEKGCEIWNLNFQNAAFKMMPNKIVKELDS